MHAARRRPTSLAPGKPGRGWPRCGTGVCAAPRCGASRTASMSTPGPKTTRCRTPSWLRGPRSPSDPTTAPLVPRPPSAALVQRLYNTPPPAAATSPGAQCEMWRTRLPRPTASTDTLFAALPAGAIPTRPAPRLRWRSRHSASSRVFEAFTAALKIPSAISECSVCCRCRYHQPDPWHCASRSCGCPPDGRMTVKRVVGSLVPRPTRAAPGTAHRKALAGTAPAPRSRRRVRVHLGFRGVDAHPHAERAGTGIAELRTIGDVALTLEHGLGNCPERSRGGRCISTS